eukprot:4840638-Prymnesium_polylepis.1
MGRRSASGGDGGAALRAGQPTDAKSLAIRIGAPMSFGKSAVRQLWLGSGGAIMARSWPEGSS